MVAGITVRCCTTQPETELKLLPWNGAQRQEKLTASDELHPRGTKIANLCTFACLHVNTFSPLPSCFLIVFPLLNLLSAADYTFLLASQEVGQCSQQHLAKSCMRLLHCLHLNLLLHKLVLDCIVMSVGFLVVMALCIAQDLHCFIPLILALLETFGGFDECMLKWLQVY